MNHLWNFNRDVFCLNFRFTSATTCNEKKKKKKKKKRRSNKK
ncbi:hypothetical protein [Candidatus Cardinium sp. cBcalN2]|nr:hypothetical protein [Candidatus Cardinium sp. cBcalN2]